MQPPVRALLRPSGQFVVARAIIPALIAYIFLSAIATAQGGNPSSSATPISSPLEHTQDFAEIVVPITSVDLAPSAKPHISGEVSPRFTLKAAFGTGFCLDAVCRFITTNYHVAAPTKIRKIKGEKVVQRYLATGPNDEGATANAVDDGVLPFAKKRDLAIFELQHALAHHHGLNFSLDELEAGQEVDIYGYPLQTINPFRKLIRFAAAFRGLTASGLMAFEYASSPSHVGGASGGIVVDRRTRRIVGIMEGTTETMALAVPVQALADFVCKVQPFLAQKIFSNSSAVSPVSAELYPKFEPPADLNSKLVLSHAGVLQRRLEEPLEVTALRENAQRMADGMRDFVAVQSFAWGSGDQEPKAKAEYEVRVIDGEQQYRSYPDGKREQVEMAYPQARGWVLPADDWSSLPKTVGTEYSLKVRRASDSIVNGRRFKVFQYYSSVEDDLCSFQPLTDYIFYMAGRRIAVACYGEVWTDEDTNIIRISQNLDLSDGSKEYKGWSDVRVVVTYDWIKIADEATRLVPLTIFTEGRNKKKVFWCQGQFTNYRKFSVRTTFIPN